MSTRLSHHPGRPVTAVLSTAIVLIGISGGVAAAKPPALDPCAMTLAAAGVWPGTVDDGRPAFRQFSDAFDGHLARQSECRPGFAAR